MLIFFDYEVFYYNWLVVFINPATEEYTIIWDDKRALAEFNHKHKDCIFIGYNSRQYDQFIHKGILLGFNPKEINDHIIVKGWSGYSFSSEFNKIPLITYDVMGSSIVSLKTLEGFMGNNIKETDVDFNIRRELTPQEKKRTEKYCIHDVEQTIEVFTKRVDDFNSHMELIKRFNLPLSFMSKTQAQLSAEILECEKVERDDEFEYEIVDTLRLKKYDFVREWFEDAKKINPRNDEQKKEFYSRTLEVNVCGVPHTFGWGGLHGAPTKPIHKKGLILHVDVNSYYPSIMIRYGLLTRNSKTPEKFKEIYDYRLQLKAEGKKKEQAPYKIVLNGTYGICKDKYNKAYDPRNANAVCVNGQLMLLDLLEHLEGHCELIQSNTDGLIIMIPDTDEAFNLVDDICYEWEQRTGMTLGLDVINEIYQKDVNNYLWLDNGKGERKGAYVKELSELDYDLPIINKCLVDYMTKKIPPEVTVNCCDDLIMYQKIVKLSSKFDYVEHNHTRYNYKSYRVFASTDRRDGSIYKVKVKGGYDVTNPNLWSAKRVPNGCDKKDKFANTPDRCFIDNGDITGVKVPAKLDKQYYIDLAKDRLIQFGIEEFIPQLNFKF